MINYAETKYLKHEASLIDIKVTIRTLNGEPRIFIRDSEFTDTKKAMAYVRRIAEKELAPIIEEEVA